MANGSGSFTRHPTTQDISWILDARSESHLDLDPPYQRKSVWTRKDRQFFLDTIFRGYPSPAIFLEKKISESGTSIYSVVDGKQRLETIFMFVDNQIKIANDFGDIRLNDKKWNQLDIEQKKLFWNYQIPVEMVGFLESQVVNEIFDRLNRNSRKLTRQELRHAKFDGWFIRFAEMEVEDPFWKRLSISRGNREKRMQDVQILSELLFIILEGKIMGFDQEELDDLYGKYDEFEENSDCEDLTSFSKSEEEFRTRLSKCKIYLDAMIETKPTLVEFLKTNSNLYSIWAVLALRTEDLPDAAKVAELYVRFMEKVVSLASIKGESSLKEISSSDDYTTAFQYWNNSRGASTDLKQRQERISALSKVLFE